MAINRVLGTEERALLKRWIRLILQEADFKRCLGLLRKRHRKLLPADDRKHPRSENACAEVLIESLLTPSLQSQTVQALQEFVIEARKAPTLDSRAKTRFIEASKALAEGNWDWFRAELERLRILHEEEELDHPLLPDAEWILLVGSGNAERIFAAIDTCLSPATHAPQTQSTVPKSMDMRPVDAGRRDIPNLVAPPLDSRASQPAETLDPHTKPGSTTLSARVLLAIDEVEALLVALNNPLPDSSGFNTVLADVSRRAQRRLSDAKTIECVEDALSILAEDAETRRQEVANTIASIRADNQAARLRAEVQLEGTSLDSLRQRWNSASQRLSEIPASHLADLDQSWTTSSHLPLYRRVAQLCSEVDDSLKALEAAEEEARIAAEIAERQAKLRLEEEAIARLQSERLRRRGATIPSIDVPALAMPGTSSQEPVKVVEVGIPKAEHSDPLLAFPRGYTQSVPQLQSPILQTPDVRPDDQWALQIVPLDPEARLRLAPASEPPHIRATALSAMLLRQLWGAGVVGTTRRSALLETLTDVRALVSAGPSLAGECLSEAVLALLLLSFSTQRQSSRARKRARAMLASCDASEFHTRFVDFVIDIIDSDGAVTVLSSALRQGFIKEIIKLAGELGVKSRRAERKLGEVLAIASTSLPDPADFRELCWKQLGLSDGQIDELEGWISAHSDRKSRSRPREPGIELPGWLGSFTQRLARCVSETTLGGVANINVSVPKAVADGVHVADRDELLMLPLLLRNSGSAAAAGIELWVTSGDGVEVDRQLESVHVSWLAASGGKEAPNDILHEFPVKLTDSAGEQAGLNCHIRWIGSKDERTKKLQFKIGTTRTPHRRKTIPGVSGEPMDLLKREFYDRSSRSVREAFDRVRDRLHAGASVRCVIYGRRRRGKSSIRASLAGDSNVLKRFAVEVSEWNGARMTLVESPFRELGRLLSRALASRNLSIRPFDPATTSDRARLYQAWKEWLTEIRILVAGRSLKVLLLIDEFQQWLASLPERADRQLLLGAFRDFNDATSGSLEVSFVLFGLRSLERLIRDSNDFTNAVIKYDVRELTLEEAASYVEQVLPIEHDSRARRRLAKLSGGNPYVLNCLCDSLAERLAEEGRPYSLVADVERIVEDLASQDSRLGSFFEYMLKEDEDQGSPSLPQLTVLRVMARLHHEARDYDGHFDWRAVEEYLKAKGVAFDEGMPLLQLNELADAGVLERHPDGVRFRLEGEAVCAWLARHAEGATPLKPVVRRVDPDIVLNRYRQTKEVGRGGQNASIWEAEDTTIDNRRVALKLYAGQEISMRARVEKEARLLSRAKGPYVVTCHDYGVDERKGGVIVMEWVEGRTLRQLIDERPASAQRFLPGGELDWQVELLKKLSDGVASIHRAGVVHKDLSAKNVMLVEHNHVWDPKLIDFGISGEVRDEAREPGEDTTFLGTVRYMAPEKKDGGQRSKPADVYSLGMLFLDVLTTHGTLEEARSLGPSGRLFLLLAEMLGTNPSDRPTAEIVRARLDGILEPDSWRELADRADTSFLDGNVEEALRYYRRALAEIPKSEFAARRAGEVVKETLRALQDYKGEVDWWDSLVKSALDIGVVQGDFDWSILADAIKSIAESSTGAGTHYEDVLRVLQTRSPTGALLLLIRELAGAKPILYRLSDVCYSLLLEYCAVGLDARAILHEFCVMRARHARLSLEPVTVVELWLRRARRALPSGSKDYESELKDLERTRETTGLHQTLPPDCDDELKIELGNSEAGHDRQDMIEKFAHRLRDAFPFVCEVRRLRKSPGLHANAPMLLDRGSGRANLENRGVPSERSIGFALDSSYCKQAGGRDGVPILMAIILPESTTEAQRQAAYDRLKENRELFPE